MKTAIISGASKGIGKAAAITFVAAGYQVFNLSRSKASVEGVIDVAIDLAGEDVQAVLAGQVIPYITADAPLVLIHNAAKLVSGALSETTGHNLTEVLNLNVTAPQKLNHALLPLMGKGSAILYVGSTLSEKAVANSFTYVTSKHAVLGMMRATCQDLAGTQIHTACVCPGFTDTEMLRDHVGNSDEVLAAIASGSTFGRLVSPQEIADLLFFAGENPVINGAVLHGNLGQIES